MSFIESGAATEPQPEPAPAAAAEREPAPAAERRPEPAPAAAAEREPAAAAERRPEPAPAAAAAGDVPTLPGDEVVEIPRLRKRIAENLVHAKRSTAHVWASVEVDYERVEQVRRRHKEQFKAREGYSLTYLPFIARATIDALAAYPVVNSSFYLEQGKQVFHTRANLGIAVDVDQKGLIVVTLRGADGLRLKGIARQIREMATKARSGDLNPDDITGSTFSITNPGPFGSFLTAPVLNLPNVAILSTDTVVKRPTVITDSAGADSIAIHHIGYLGLTWDHRAFDGSTAVLFLARIKENLETWDWEAELQ
jgi:pyruvate dehydrogenase E2 component (dihydrolipoamide acetyltransferase)